MPWMAACSGSGARAWRSVAARVRYRTDMYMLLAIAAGAGLALQAVINTRLRDVTGSAIWAALIQTFVGLATLTVLAVATRDGVPAVAGWSRAPWWVWTGGLLGATYVVAVILTTAPLGAALMVMSVIVGQIVTALLIDHHGWLGVEVQRLSATRLLGAALLVAGVLLIRLR
jgi:transporter family-2 protein